MDATHPKDLLPLYTQIAREKFGVDAAILFELSRYVYVPQAISERRESFWLPSETAIEDFGKRESELKLNEEIAFHSRIQVNTRIFHIPLLDMSCENIEQHLPELQRALKDYGILEFTIFSSGRSFHIYCHSLLTSEDELINFMGRILLLNLPGQDRVVDERWVGHRLMARSLTLRWTCNSPHYKVKPHFYRKL